MHKSNHRTSKLLPMILVLTVSGCAARQVDLSKMQRPERSDKLKAYDIFVGSWTWEAEMLNATAEGKSWKGTAEWKWTLDQRCLEGRMSAESGKTKFESTGVWSRHPTTGKYIWWMFNNWGYPQQGTAAYDEKAKCWTMTYTSVGLDGTDSHGRYVMKVVDDNTLDWRMEEWADGLHAIKKMEMKGTYKRKK